MFFKCRTDDMELREEEKDDGSEPLIPLATHKPFDFILVANKLDDDTRCSDQKFQRRRDFIQQLEKKNIRVTKITHEDKIFYGVRAPSEMFEDYQYLLKVSDSCNWCGDVNGVVTHSNRKGTLFGVW